MHENLKMKLDLVVDSKEPPTWQAISGIQRYGTFYMIYARFKGYKQKTIGKPPLPVHIYTFDFRIQNFSGPVTFGLSTEDIEIKSNKTYLDEISNKYSPEVFKKIRDTENWHYQLNVKVLPFFVNPELHDVELKFKDKIEGKELDIHLYDFILEGGLYNPKDLDGSRYIDPMSWRRDGENWLKKSYRLVDKKYNPIPDGDGVVDGLCYPRRVDVIKSDTMKSE